MPNGTLNLLHNSCIEKTLFNRYINLDMITPLLNKWRKIIEVETIGKSVNEEDIHALTIGNGPIKILMWSQMHGNESTTTKALFDLFNFLDGQTEESKSITRACTITVVPMLNPDGARAYTRLNANGVDLNRDAQVLSQPESKVLRSLFDEFQPDFCFNLHGQRTIFSAGNTDNSAIVSFLAPAQDAKCSITENRKIAMDVISVMNSNLQLTITNNVGIYDDTFNINCVGDTFQSLNVPTILVEAGHFSNDYSRELTRRFIFDALVVALNYISVPEIARDGHSAYLKIPQNKKLFFDIIIRNTEVGDIAIQYEESLNNDRIEFVPKVEKIDDLSEFYAHLEVNAEGNEVIVAKGTSLKLGNQIDYVKINNEKFSFLL
ncbi:peptidase M14 [Flavobacteriales bacterium 34_180_T64]|nr:peptidase M14 [Flavobacteriales bacterium 34_180_T64]